MRVYGRWPPYLILISSLLDRLYCMTICGDGYAPRLLIGEIYKYIGERMNIYGHQTSGYTRFTHTILQPDYGRCGMDSKLDEIYRSAFGFDSMFITESYASLAEKVVGVKVGFHNKVICQFAKLNMIDVIEDVNEKHCDHAGMLSKSSPPITNTPFMPNLPKSLLTKNHIAFDGTKMKRLF
ncbi:hypothetical protein H4Q26_012840 [Puccinia striiformis f. sp. tritici PST-130]|nr:hypothetical protein H4Q26_012840 [Puccinia striiformis f. sp. tritici PST-130]